MTLRLTLDQQGKVTSYAILDNANPPGCHPPVTPLVLDNIALLRLVPLLDKVEGVGVRLSSSIYIVCELPSGYNPPLDDLLLFIGTAYP
jgi:hypothetical protein